MKIRKLWRDQRVSVYDYFYLIFLVDVVLAIIIYPEHPLTVMALQKLPVFTAKTYALIMCLIAVTLAWRRWIPTVRLLLLAPLIIYVLIILVFALPAVGKPSDFIITAVVIGWTLLFIRG